MSNLDWGSVPVWVATSITSISAALAVGSYRRSLYDKEREQASKVSCWVSTRPNVNAAEERPGEFMLSTWMVINVANRSEAPIFDLDITGFDEKLQSTEMPPGATGFCTVPVAVRQVRTSLASFDFEEQQLIAFATPTLTFTDALGRRWRRQGARLRRVRKNSQQIGGTIRFTKEEGGAIKAAIG
jgi:hypothetical protein